MRKLLAVIGVVAVALGAGSCGRSPASPIDRQMFEDVMVQLRRAEVGIDTAEFGARRQTILESMEVTDSMLYAFVGAHATDPGYMAAVWEAIDLRINGSSQGSGIDTLGRR
jgi:hypothetical protein